MGQMGEYDLGFVVVVEEIAVMMPGSCSVSVYELVIDVSEMDDLVRSGSSSLG